MRALVLVLTLLTWAVPAAAGPIDHRAVAHALTVAGDTIVAAYRPEDGALTGDAISDLYFGVFEESGLEADLGAFDPSLKTTIESHFASVIALATRGAAPAELHRAWQDLSTEVRTAADRLAERGSGSGTGAFLQSLLILLREGFEAILVVGALTAYLRRLGAADSLRLIGWAVAAAVAASLLTAVVLATLLDASGAAREGLEGVTVLVAAAVLAYVSHWLFARRDAERWKTYIKDQIGRAVSGGEMASVAFAAFLAVYREGAETVLFYQALLSSSPGQTMPIVAGFAVAAVGLVAIYWTMRTASMRLPLGPFFTATALLLYALAVVFAGQGVLELQEARWVGATPLPAIPRLPALGLFPTVETVAAQAVVLLALIPLGTAWMAGRRKAT